MAYGGPHKKGIIISFFCPIIFPMNLPKAACFVLVIAAVALGFLVYPSLPESVPIHWNAVGEADGYGPSWVGAFLFPLGMALVLLFLVVVPKIAVFKENMRAFERQYWLLGAMLELFFILFFAITLAPNYCSGFNFSQALALLLAMLFVFIGWLAPSFKRNFFVGIRTPWTLANDKVWEKTHKLGGRLFIAAGLITLLGALFPSHAFWIAITAILVAAVAAVAYSFLLYRKTGKRQV
jgi:uncharacterized membrane protein